MKQNGSTICPKSGYECGPCIEGQQEVLSTQGSNFEKCRPIPGYQVSTENPVFALTTAGLATDSNIENWFKKSGKYRNFGICGHLVNHFDHCYLCGHLEGLPDQDSR